MGENRADIQVPRTAALTERQRWILHVERRFPFLGQLTLAVVREAPARIGIDALRRVLHELGSTHEALRTRLVTRRGETVQIVEPVSALSRMLGIEVVLTGGSLRDRLRAWRRQDLVLSDSVARAAVLPDGDRCWVALSVHHVVCDGWAREVLGRDLAALLAQPDRPLHRRSQPREHLDDHRAADVDYWRHELHDAPLSTTLAACRVDRGPHRADRRASMPLEPPLRARLDQAGRRHKVTLFMTAVAAVSALVGAYGGCHEVVLRTFLVNRSSARELDSVCCLSKEVFLRIRGTPADTWGDRLRLARDTCLRAYPRTRFDSIALEEWMASTGLRRGGAFWPRVLLNFHPGQASGQPGEMRTGGPTAGPQPAGTPRTRILDRVGEDDLEVTIHRGADGVPQLAVTVGQSVWQHRAPQDVLLDLRSAFEHLATDPHAPVTSWSPAPSAVGGLPMVQPQGIRVSCDLTLSALRDLGLGDQVRRVTVVGGRLVAELTGGAGGAAGMHGTAGTGGVAGGAGPGSAGLRGALYARLGDYRGVAIPTFVSPS